MLMYLEIPGKEGTFPNILYDKITLTYAFTCLYSPTAKFRLGKNSSMPLMRLIYPIQKLYNDN